MDPTITSTLISVLGALLAALLGYLFGRGASDKLIKTKRFTPENAKDLLVASRPDEWNEVRDLSPDWTPNLTSADLHGANLAGVNFRRSLLRNANLSGACLDYSDLTEADLTGANLESASMRGARLTRAVLRGAKLAGALLENADLLGADLAAASLAAADTKSGSPFEDTDGATLARKVAESPELIQEISETAFERLISHLFETSGHSVEQPSASRREPYDLVLYRPSISGQQELLIVELKRYPLSRKVGVSPIRSLHAARLSSGANRAYLVTTGILTNEAQQLARDLGDIEIIDRPTVLSWIERIARQTDQ